ncbi:hypothetical protein [Streptomyces sp. H27-C3]|uniref:hypothetical protein n=1 Tax=Streptomyces sp. H27-C3 TaxID=3046305 RepID=UPI0032D93D0C
MTDRRAATRTIPPPEKMPVNGLWNRDFQLFFAARTVARFGDGMAPVALAAGLLATGRDASAVSFALGAWMVCFAGFVLFGGVLADRFTPRRMIVIADAMRLVSAGVLALVFAVLGPLIPLEAVVVTERHGSTVFGIMMAVNGAGNAVGGLLAMRLKPRRPLFAGAFAAARGDGEPAGARLRRTHGAARGGVLRAGGGGGLRVLAGDVAHDRTDPRSAGGAQPPARV